MNEKLKCILSFITQKMRTTKGVTPREWCVEVDQEDEFGNREWAGEESAWSPPCRCRCQMMKGNQQNLETNLEAQGLEGEENMKIFNICYTKCCS